MRFKERSRTRRVELAKEKKKKARSGRPKDSKNKSKQLNSVLRLSSRPSINPENLSKTYPTKLKKLLLHDRRLATAYRLMEEMRLIFKLSSIEDTNNKFKLSVRMAYGFRNIDYLFFYDHAAQRQLKQ